MGCKTTFVVLDVQDNTGCLHGSERVSSRASTSSSRCSCSLLFFMIARYVKAPRGSPRELYLMFFTKLTSIRRTGRRAIVSCFIYRKMSGSGIVEPRPITLCSAWS